MRRRWIVAVSLALALGSLAGCSSEPKPATQPVAGGSPAAAGIDAAALVARATAAMRALKSYRVVSTVTTRTSRGPVVVTVDSAFELPGRVKSRTTAEGLTVDSVTINGNTWIKDPKTGVWKSKINAPGGSGVTSPFGFLGDVVVASDSGSETIGGTTAIKVEGSVAADALLRSFGQTAPQPGKIAVTLWIDQATSRLLKMSETASKLFTVSATFSDFGARFGIVAPR